MASIPNESAPPIHATAGVFAGASKPYRASLLESVERCSPAFSATFATLLSPPAAPRAALPGQRYVE